MRLKKIIDFIKPEKVINPSDFEITGLTYNSNQVQPGNIFICLVGEKVDGHGFAEQALEKGALAIISERPLSEINMPQLIVKNTKYALAQVAALMNDSPSSKLNMVGVTGTNGKTTVTHLLERIFESAGRKCGLIGTLGQRMSSEQGYSEAKHTTPQAPELQATLKKMLNSGVEDVVMEVSSHSLEQNRVGLCEFNGAVLTNLTQDHLDYHITMDNYFKAKAKLFENVKKYAVINNDDNRAQDFKGVVKKDIKILTYGIEAESDVMAKNIDFSAEGASFECTTPVGSKSITLKMTGLFSVYNALAALATGIAEGVDFDICITALEQTKSVAGRFETVTKEPLTIVDYAHTPDGLDNVLKAARKIVPEDGRLICLFGCGGDRDATKRPQMARIADNLADIVVITSDNPRSEDPQQIITDILTGINSLCEQRIYIEIDRKLAIEQAVKIANPKDVVVFAGKGHEDYQILKDKTIHFDDREEVKLAYEKYKL